MRAFLILLQVCILSTAYSQAHTHVQEELAMIMNDFLEETNLPGVSVAVRRNGKALYSKGFGYADIENEFAMQAATRIRTASVAKMITVTALAKLVTDGKLDIDAPIKNYIPYLEEPYAMLTARQLASHTSGIPHRPASNAAKRKSYTDTRERVRLVQESDLLFDPGTAYQYSTLAYNLLEGVIAGASEKSYLEYLQEELFTPLGMDQTIAESELADTSEEANMYFFKKGKLTLDKKLFKTSHKLPGAGFRSTSIDLAKMMDAYTNGFIATHVRDDFYSNQILENGEKLVIGVGWRLNQDVEHRPTIEHAGSMQGARTVIVHYPEQGLSIAMMINAQCILFIEETAHVIAQLFLREHRVVGESKNYNGPVKLNGTNADGSNHTLDGHLILKKDGRGTLRIKTETSFLKESRIMQLGTKDNYILFTELGLLQLRLAFDPELTGQLFVYQAMEFEKNPFLTLTSPTE